MLTPFDDYLAHQAPTTMDHVLSSDRRFYDRFYFNFFDASGAIYLVCGMASYPNTQVMDGFASLTLDGITQRNLRLSRTLVDRDRYNTVVGPFAIEMIEPLRKMRLRCGENQQGFAFDVVCETLTRPFERQPEAFTRVNGRVFSNTSHYSQSYRCSGSITIDGRVHTVTPDRWWGVRDHSWGVRPGIYGPDAPNGPTGGGHGEYVGCWIPIAFDDCYLKLYFRPGVEGGELIFPWDDPRPARHIVDIERANVELDNELQRFLRCELNLLTEDQEAIALQVERLSSSYIRGGGYGGVGSFYHGKPMGTLHVEGETWDLTDPKFIPGRRGTVDHLAEFRWGDRRGYGIFEVDDDGLAERPYAKYVAPRRLTAPDALLVSR